MAILAEYAIKSFTAAASEHSIRCDIWVYGCNTGRYIVLYEDAHELPRQPKNKQEPSSTRESNIDKLQ